MGNEKPFRTHNQMLKILRDRNMEVPTSAKRILERENYYCIINGYKDLFLKPESEIETYIDGTSFYDVYTLFLFDRELRSILFPTIIQAESYIKSLLAYYFHLHHPEKNSFLAFENYRQDNSYAGKVLKTISTLSCCISNQKNNAVTYYIDTYQHCPLWVLTNFLTFGQISKMFAVCSPDIRLDISKHFSKDYGREYKIRVHFSAEMLDEAIGALVMIRNCCAHDERLYNYKTKAKTRALSKALNARFIDENRLFTSIVFLKIFLTKKDYRRLIRKISNLFKTYDSKFNVISLDDIKEVVGYQQAWIDANL